MVNESMNEILKGISEKSLIIMRGVPGVGKSTWIKKHHLEDYVISPDTFRIMLSKPVMTREPDSDLYYLGINQKESKEAWDLTFKFIEHRLNNGSTTIVDATHCFGKYTFDRYEKLAEKHGFKMYIVDFMKDVSLEEIKRRNNGRKGTIHYVPESIIERMYENSLKQDLTAYTVLPGNHEIGRTIYFVTHGITEYFSFQYELGELEEVAKNFNPDSSDDWHKLINELSDSLRHVGLGDLDYILHKYDMKDKYPHLLDESIRIHGSTMMQVIAMEELAELQKEISKAIRWEPRNKTKTDKEALKQKVHLAEEIADVLNCIRVVMRINGITDEDVEKMKYIKKMRQYYRVDKHILSYKPKYTKINYVNNSNIPLDIISRLMDTKEDDE